MAITREVLKEAIADLKASVVEFKSARGVLAILRLMPAIVHKVEAIGEKTGIRGADKKELALSILFVFLPNPLPWYLPESLIRLYAGMLIEKAVTELKKILEK